LQFTSFRGATFESAVYSLSKLQFTHFRGATFEIAVYSFSPPKPFPINTNHPKMLPQNPQNVPTKEKKATCFLNVIRGGKFCDHQCFVYTKRSFLKIQGFTPFRGASFEIAVYSFS